ncbi:HDOD domain-containing protein [Sulfuricystis multivorans]|uniref:HDOD domain-containing protein n=1 Tax=Sulfuricystis multivorans TaxID=2211108 RepID=UPI000F824953|nr:HDOD domain-containing protein [Sulfuricystis multivorans]
MTVERCKHSIFDHLVTISNIMADLSQAEAEKIIAGVAIPPRPAIVNAVLEERGKDEPDLRRISQLISTDVGLAAAVLKTVNSPFFGLRRQVTSIEHGVSMLGMKNIGTLVMSLALRNAVPTQGLDRFWDEAARTALVAAYLAQVLDCATKEDAHLFGLFHNAGIPLLMRRFPNYKEVLRMANSEMNRSFTDVEDAELGTNHALVGALLAKGWQLPEHIRAAIAQHHDLDVFTSHLPSESLNLIALALLAQYIESETYRVSPSIEWQKRGANVLDYLMLDEQQLDEVIKDARNMLDESGL